jgi:hypothetical protein
MCKIKINHKEKALVNCKTGEILHPSCFDDLSLLHNYMVQDGNASGADELLERVFKGEKVITNMIEEAQHAHDKHVEKKKKKKAKK